MRRKNPAAVALGRLGGKARAATLTADELSAIGRNAVQARWKKVKKAKAKAKAKAAKKGKQS